MASYLGMDEGGLALRLQLTRISGETPNVVATTPAADSAGSKAPSTTITPTEMKSAGSGAEPALVDLSTGKPMSKNAIKKLAKDLHITVAELEAKGSAEVTELLKQKSQKGKVKPNWEGNKDSKLKKEKAKAAKLQEQMAINNKEAAEQPMTPKGEKKRMAPSMTSKYQPKLVEAAWQDWWEASKFNTADAAAAEEAGPEGRFVIVIPPPNVTGRLHLGHALTAAIEDTLTRWHRMKGDHTLYVPGTDHAGIATQTIVEKQLRKMENKTRFDLGREKFLERVWEWKNEYGGSICNQIRQLGSSVDWSREAFTMDAKCSRAVTEAFVRFHKAGIIKRDKRLVNWSCALKSAISNIEVEKIDIEGGAMFAVPGHTKREKYQFGMFTEFAYKLKPGQAGVKDGEEIVVATTRLETMLGDTAVAVKFHFSLFPTHL